MDEQDEALRARAEARLGTTLKDKYRLDRVLGIGGMATVFAATHRNQAELAVKLLHAELSLRDDLRKRFLREGYVGNSVKHPGAVLVVDDDVAEDGSAFLVMELLRGRSLETIWEGSGRRIPPRAVAALMVQLLDVLAAAHEKAIVHRDLKPANLFLTVDASVKVLDFGIARLRDAVGSSEHATRTGTLMGTPAFMAPEQAQAIITEIDAQTDLWAVGATMFTLITGSLVHEGNNSSQILIKAGTSQARPLLDVAPDAPPAIAQVVDKALAFDKASRWPSAEAMRDALVEAAVGAFGKVPGREDVAPLVEADRQAESAKTERAPSGHAPRLVVGGESNVQVSDPTFATPSAQRPSAPVSSGLPRSGTSVSARSTPLVGTSTANPVSAESPGSARKVPVSAIVTALALLMAVVAVAFAFHGRSVAEAPPAAALAPPPQPPAPPPSILTPPAVEAPLPPVPPVAASSPAPVAPPPPPPPMPRTSPATSPPKASTKAVGPKAPPASSADCPLTYTLNANGDKIWKSVCEH